LEVSELLGRIRIAEEGWDEEKYRNRELEDELSSLREALATANVLKEEAIRELVEV